MIPQLYDCFKHWSEKGSVYIISDLHFNDPDCKLIDPNWITPEEQIEILNKIIHKNDTLIHLGDCGDLSCFAKLKAGRKILIKGNHDDKGDNFYKEVFDEVYSGPLFIGPKLLLSHEQINCLTFCLNIHGHHHDGPYHEITPWDGSEHYNLAANVCGYIPMNLGQEIKKGLLANINDIHRQTIDWATKRKEIIIDSLNELGNTNPITPKELKIVLKGDTNEWRHK